ncbi:hypothetical protein DFH09DRAFT_1099245 [Mycena vulgaris]|nr:hypothetical protein DFH09DRAFT_1099245 [Mycena vulgaris]
MRVDFCNAGYGIEWAGFESAFVCERVHLRPRSFETWIASTGIMICDRSIRGDSNAEPGPGRGWWRRETARGDDARASGEGARGAGCRFAFAFTGTRIRDCPGLDCDDGRGAETAQARREGTGRSSARGMREGEAQERKCMTEADGADGGKGIRVRGGDWGARAWAADRGEVEGRMQTRIKRREGGMRVGPSGRDEKGAGKERAELEPNAATQKEESEKKSEWMARAMGVEGGRRDPRPSRGARRASVGKRRRRRLLRRAQRRGAGEGGPFGRGVRAGCRRHRACCLEVEMLKLQFDHPPRGSKKDYIKEVRTGTHSESLKQSFKPIKQTQAPRKGLTHGVVGTQPFAIHPIAFSYKGSLGTCLSHLPLARTYLPSNATHPTHTFQNHQRPVFRAHRGEAHGFGVASAGDVDFRDALTRDADLHLRTLELRDAGIRDLDLRPRRFRRGPAFASAGIQIRDLNFGRACTECGGNAAARGREPWICAGGDWEPGFESTGIRNLELRMRGFDALGLGCGGGRKRAGYGDGTWARTQTEVGTGGESGRTGEKRARKDGRGKRLERGETDADGCRRGAGGNEAAGVKGERTRIIKMRRGGERDAASTRRGVRVDIKWTQEAMETMGAMGVSMVNDATSGTLDNAIAGRPGKTNSLRKGAVKESANAEEGEDGCEW